MSNTAKLMNSTPNTGGMTDIKEKNLKIRDKFIVVSTAT